MTGKFWRGLARSRFSWLELICVAVAAQLAINDEIATAFALLVLGAVLNTGIEHYANHPTPGGPHE